MSKKFNENNVTSTTENVQEVTEPVQNTEKVSDVLKEQAGTIFERAKDANKSIVQQQEEERDSYLVHSNRGKIIAVWGDNGITSLSTVLAGELARDGKHVLIINMNRVLPANAIWHVNTPVKPDKSIGSLLKFSEINASNISKFFAIDSKLQPNVATIAYCDGTNVVMNNEQAAYKIYVQMLKSAQNIVDYVIIDCVKEISDMMTLAAFQFADYQVFAFTPDVRGIQFFKANVPLLANEQFNNSKRIYITNMCMSCNDSVAFGDVIKQNIVAKLPIDDGIRKSISVGEFLKANQYVGHAYKKELNNLIKEFN